MHFVKFSHLGSTHSYAKVHDHIYLLHYLKPLNCSFASFNNNNKNNNNNNDNNNNKIDNKKNVIQKIKLKFTHSVNLGPIIANNNIITKNKNKIDVPVVTKLVTSCYPN